MDIPKSSMLNEIKPDRERQLLYDFTYMWNIKQKKTNEQTKQIRNRSWIQRTN